MNNTQEHACKIVYQINLKLDICSKQNQGFSVISQKTKNEKDNLRNHKIQFLLKKIKVCYKTWKFLTLHECKLKFLIGGVAIADQDEEEEDELDEATRQFNFWTHQVHIFFVRKFFPAAEKFLQLRQLVERRNMEMTKQKIAETPSRRESVKVN